MKIQSLSNLYKQCKLPNVTKDIFGEPLNMGNVSDMFIKGQQVLVTDYNKNFKRPQPLEFYLTKTKIIDYIKQFSDYEYVQGFCKIFKGL